MIMNKTQLVEVVVAKTGMKKKDAEAAVAAVTDAITEALAAGDKVQLIGFGTFEVKESAEREGRNPRTGETIKIPARTKAKFRLCKAAKDAVLA